MSILSQNNFGQREHDGQDHPNHGEKDTDIKNKRSPDIEGGWCAANLRPYRGQEWSAEQYRRNAAAERDEKSYAQERGGVNQECTPPRVDAEGDRIEYEPSCDDQTPDETASRFVVTSQEEEQGE